MTRAVAKAFPGVVRLSCTLHLKQNLSLFITKHCPMKEKQRVRFLKEIFGRKGIVNTAADIVELEIGIDALLEGRPQSLVDYINASIKPHLLENMKIFALKPHLFNSNESRLWTNNNAESLNSVFKSATDHKTLALVDLVQELNNLVQNHYLDIKRSLVGIGNYRLSDEFRRFFVSPHDWAAKSLKSKSIALGRFTSALCDMRLVRSSDQLSTEPKPMNWEKKTCQRKRRSEKKKNKKKQEQ